MISKSSPLYDTLKSRLRELDTERKSILKVLGNTKPRKRRKPMSEAARKAAAERMKKYWASRKKKGKRGPAAEASDTSS